jgi:hypothetical protein
MRILNRLLVALLSLAIAGAGLLTAAEVLVARTSWPHDPPLVVPYDHWLRVLRPHTWDQTAVRLICIGVLIIGVLLVVAAATAQERRMPLVSAHPDVEMSTTRRALARALRKDASQVDGVATVSSRVSRRTARVVATIRIGDEGAVERELQSRLTERLESISLAGTPRLGVTVKTRRSR